MNPLQFRRVQRRFPLLSLVFGWLMIARLCAAPVVTEWTPIFKGIDLSVGTNTTSSGSFVHVAIGRAFRVDLQDPDIRLLTSPRIEDYNPGVRETAGMTVSRFLQTNELQVAVNGGFFDPGTYYLPENTPMTVKGLAISKGEVVSPQNSRINSASILFDERNVGRIVHTNWPAGSTDGIQTAISGNYPLVYHGKNIGGLTGDQDVAPRTAMGLSEDGRYLYIVCIDGRQHTSAGANDSETGAWMLLWGAYDAVNLDGGGSTTMVIEDSTGKPKRINSSSAVADSGKERTVGSHFGVFAKPVPGFIRDISVAPEDETAVVSWHTAAAASAQLNFGLTTDLGTLTELQNDNATNHTVRLSGLKPGGSYYFKALSQSGGTAYESELQLFTTANPVTTNQVITLTSPWMYSTDVPTDAAWTQQNFDESAWLGPAEGMLWVNVRNNNNGVEPLGAQLPADPNTAFPYVTYYARAHFSLPSQPTKATVFVSGFVDDGAVVYLNGREIQRIRMEDAPTPILNESLALVFPCDGDATCRDEFLIEDDAAVGLTAGDNVFAVEVHNYNARSYDITMGFDVTVYERVVTTKPTLQIRTDATGTQVAWTGTGFSLESAESPEGPWSLVPGPITTSPYVVPFSAAARFYRLKK